MDTTRSAVSALYGEVSAGEQRHERALADWQIAFERLHGPLERKRQVDRRVVARAYGLDEAVVSLPHLLFAIETFLALYLIASAEALTPSLSSPNSRWTDAVRQAFEGGASSEFPLTRLASPYVSHLPRIDDQAIVETIVAGVRQQLIADQHRQDVFDDVFRQHYHALVPKQVRHSIGAHFTPPWLAEYALTLAGFTPETAGSCSLLDPTVKSNPDVACK